VNFGVILTVFLFIVAMVGTTVFGMCSFVRLAMKVRVMSFWPMSNEYTACQNPSISN
jgi:hypothetical protein